MFAKKRGGHTDFHFYLVFQLAAYLVYEPRLEVMPRSYRSFLLATISHYRMHPQVKDNPLESLFALSVLLSV